MGADVGNMSELKDEQELYIQLQVGFSSCHILVPTFVAVMVIIELNC